MKKVLIIIGLIIFGIILVSLFSSGDYKLNDSGEGLAYTRLRSAITTSKANGTGSITISDFNTLGAIAKNANSNNEWFKSSSGVYVGKIIDTSDNEKVVLTDGTYCAVFTIRNVDNWDYYLVDYVFEIGTVTDGANIGIQ